MGDERTRCAEAALAGAGAPNGWGITVRELVAQPNGHHFFQGWHIGWVWGVEDGRGFLDLLSEHRMAGMGAARYFADGSSEPLDTPHEFHLVGKTPEEDAELERAYFDHNRAAYASLRERGLLPPPGANLVSQDVNEFLHSGGDTTDVPDDQPSRAAQRAQRRIGLREPRRPAGRASPGRVCRQSGGPALL